VVLIEEALAASKAVEIQTLTAAVDHAVLLVASNVANLVANLAVKNVVNLAATLVAAKNITNITNTINIINVKSAAAHAIQ